MLAVKDWRALELRKVAGRHVLVACALTLPIFAALVVLPASQGRIVALAVNICAFSYLKGKLTSDIDESRARFTIVTRSWYSAIPWALLGIVLFLLFFIVTSVALALAGVPLPE